jgi:hypothetical protein
MTPPADNGGMRRLLLALLALLAVTALGGCGGADASLIAAAVHNTEQAGGAEVAFQMKMSVPGVDQPIVMTGNGVEDASRRRGRLSFDMSALAQVPGAGALCGDGCEMEAVMDGFALYMHSSLFGAALGGKEWLKLDLERFGDRLGVPMGDPRMAAQSPSEGLRMLGGVSGDVTDEGREQVRGVETTHYSATVDLRRSVEALPESQREAARRGMERLIAMTGQEQVPFDVWIDDDDRIRRFEMEQSTNSGGVQVKTHVTMEYVRFGVPVEIDPPEDDDVLDMTDLALQQLNQDLR